MRKVIPDCQIMHAVVMRGPSSPNLEPEMLLKEIQEPLRHLVACQARRGDNVEAVVADLHLDYAAVFREEDVIRVLTATGGGCRNKLYRNDQLADDLGFSNSESSASTDENEAGGTFQELHVRVSRWENCLPRWATTAPGKSENHDQADATFHVGCDA